MFQIVVASGKGGVGKTLVSSSLLYLLRDKNRVIGMDGDAPTPNLHLPFGIDNWDEERDYIGGKVASIDEERCSGCESCLGSCPYEAIVPAKDGEVPRILEFLCEGCGVCGLVCHERAIVYHDAVSGRSRMSRTGYDFPLISARLDVGRPNSGKLVAQERAWVRELGKKDERGLVVIDGAAGIGCSVMASVTGTDMAILVAEPTPASLSDVMRMFHVTSHFGVPSFMVVNKSDMNPGWDGIERFAKSNGIKIIARIPYDRDIPRSMSVGRPFLEMYHSNPSSKELVKLAEYVAIAITGEREVSI
jgi:MinD superfamily P-loop ATPase